MAVAATLLTSLAVTGCGGEEAPAASAPPTPAVCSSVDALKSSVADLKNVDLSKGSLAPVQDKLTAMQADLTKVGKDAKTEYATEVDSVEAATSSVGASLQAAQAAPSQRTLTAVRTSVTTLGTSLRALEHAVRSTC